MGISVALANQMNIAASSYALFMSLHQADPGSTGANEISVNSYDRRPCSWQASPTSGYLKIPSAGIPFRVPGASSIGFYGFWTQASAGTWCGGMSATTVETFASPGTYTCTSVNWALA